MNAGEASYRTQLIWNCSSLTDNASRRYNDTAKRPNRNRMYHSTSDFYDHLTAQLIDYAIRTSYAIHCMDRDLTYN